LRAWFGCGIEGRQQGIPEGFVFALTSMISYVILQFRGQQSEEFQLLP